MGDEADEIRSLTLGCYCPSDVEYCHRFYLAKHVLKGCAAYFGIDYEYAGEQVKAR